MTKDTIAKIIQDHGYPISSSDIALRYGVSTSTVECFPNTQIAADKFHTVRLANDALVSVRKQLQKKLPQEQQKHFKRSRYLLLSRENNLKKDANREALQIILNYSDELSCS